MTSSVSVTRSVALNRDAVVPLVRARLETLAEASEHGTVMLFAGLPGGGQIAVPVRLRVTYASPRASRFTLSIRALTSSELYPRFRGVLELTAAGTAATIVALSGEYAVPFGLLGNALDATAARHIAPHGLAGLIDRLVRDVSDDAARDANLEYRAGRRSV